jgi:hypothetical protein
VKGRCTISFTGRVRNGTPLISRGFHGGRRTDVDAARVLLDSMRTKIPRYCRPVPRRACRSTGGCSPWTGPLASRASWPSRPSAVEDSLGYSPSEKASPHSAAGVDAGTTVLGQPVPGPGRDAVGSPGGGPSRLSIPQAARARHRHRVGSDDCVGPASDPIPKANRPSARGGVLSPGGRVDVRPRPVCRRSAR